MMEVVINTDRGLLKDLSKRLVETMKEKNFSESTIFDVHVSFEEALRNAMIHGNKSDPNKKIKVKAEVAEKKVIVSVEDEGKGFDPAKIPDPTLDENLLKENGRGIYLIKHLMDSVHYEHGGRKIVMIKNINSKHKPSIH